MKSFFFIKNLLFVNVLISVFGCSSPKKMVTNWQTKPLVATGIAKDWNVPLQYDKKSKFWYNISNDSENLYLMLRADDESLKHKILMMGLRIFIDTTNHKRETLGIHFPKAHSHEQGGGQEYKALNAKSGGKSTDHMKDNLREKLQIIELIGFNNRESDVMMITDSKIKPIVTMDSTNAIIYQCVLPLKYIFKSPSSQHIISIGMATGNPQYSNYRGGRSQGTGNTEMVGVQMAYRSGRSERMNEANRLSEPSSVWIMNYCISCKK